MFPLPETQQPGPQPETLIVILAKCKTAGTGQNRLEFKVVRTMAPGLPLQLC